MPTQNISPNLKKAGRILTVPLKAIRSRLAATAVPAQQVLLCTLFGAMHSFTGLFILRRLVLLKHNKKRLAKGGINNLLHLLDSLDFAPNANAHWGSNRSQPPYLSKMVCTDIIH